MDEVAIQKKLQRLGASDERHQGRRLTVQADRASVFRNPETGQTEGPDSAFARQIIAREKEAARWKT